MYDICDAPWTCPPPSRTFLINMESVWKIALLYCVHLQWLLAANVAFASATVFVVSSILMPWAYIKFPFSSLRKKSKEITSSCPFSIVFDSSYRWKVPINFEHFYLWLKFFCFFRIPGQCPWNSLLGLFILRSICKFLTTLWITLWADNFFPSCLLGFVNFHSSHTIMLWIDL